MRWVVLPVPRAYLGWSLYRPERCAASWRSGAEQGAPLSFHRAQNSYGPWFQTSSLLGSSSKFVWLSLFLASQKLIVFLPLLLCSTLSKGRSVLLVFQQLMKNIILKMLFRLPPQQTYLSCMV